MRAEQIQTMFDYHYGMFEQIWRCVLKLNTKQFVAKTDYSVGSLRNQLVHCVSVDDRWLARLQGITPLPSYRPSDFRQPLMSYLNWKSLSLRMLSYVGGLTAADLDEVVDLHFPARGGAKRNPRWQILLHVVNHGTDHRAQILARLHQLGAPTFEQDLILHLWAQDE